MPKKKNKNKSRKAHATPVTFEGNYVPASQPGCHVAHHDAPWIIEASDFDPEDYGLAPGEEDSVPDMIVDPETKSLRCTECSAAIALHHVVEICQVLQRYSKTPVIHTIHSRFLRLHLDKNDVRNIICFAETCRSSKVANWCGVSFWDKGQREVQVASMDFGVMALQCVASDEYSSDYDREPRCLMYRCVVRATASFPSALAPG